METKVATSAPLLTIDNLSIGYEGVPILGSLNLKLNPGELVCFMGPNGVGKSSFIKTLMKLLNPVSGQFQYSELGPIERVVSVVLTDRIRHPQLTVHELITMGRYPFLDWRMNLSDEDKSKIEKAIQQTNTEHLRNRKITELSDGQMQMVMIARALAQSTRVLLLDEPTAHLDLNNRVEIMNLLKRLSRETNRAILIATHEIDLALQTADRVWIAGSGKTIKTGIPEDLVLNGSFDEVFKFKGYDLKTGKVFHEAFRGKTVNVKGEGYALLWTKNALERNGFSIDNGSLKVIEIESVNEKKITWKIEGRSYNDLNSLIQFLESWY